MKGFLLHSVILFGLLSGMASSVARGQEATVLYLETNLPEAMVYADSIWLGPATLGQFLVPPEARNLRLVPPAADTWSVTPLIHTLHHTTDTTRLTLDFPYHYKIESIPFGQEVYHETEAGRESLGETPLLYQSDEQLEGLLVIDTDGFERVAFVPGLEIWNRHVVAMQPLESYTAQRAEVDLRQPKKSKKWIDVLAVGTAISAGVLAVHFKQKADRAYDLYEETGDPALRPQIEQYDTYSAVSLGVMQVGVGVFAIRLVLK